MSRYASNATISELARRIESARRIMLTTHAKPDGDGIGSALALHRALVAKGRSADIYLIGPLESGLRVIAGPTPFMMVDAAEASLPGDDYDLAIVADTGAWSQLEPLGPWLRRHHERIIGIDHHSHGDDVASLRLVDPSAASTTQLLVGLLDEMGCPLTGGVGGVAEALFVGLATDSGWFRYAAAGAEAFRVAARLMECGVDKSRLYQIIEEQYEPRRLALQARALASVEYARDGAVALMLLGVEDFKATGGSLEDLTTLVNAPMSIGSVRVSILLAQTEPGQTKVSFRSKPQPADAGGGAVTPGVLDGPWDVNQFARRFGGGGHTHAAGARLEMDIDRARQAILEAMGEQARRPHPSPLPGGEGT